MIQVKILECAEPQADHLEQYKQYASVPDDSRDGILHKMLKRAMLQVQAFSDVAMLPCLLELTITDVKAGDTVKLYQGGDTVVSCVDQDGLNAGYVQEGDALRMLGWSHSLRIVYRNRVVIPEAEALQPVCWELATAIYDGEDTKVQGTILAKTYGMR